MATRGRPPGSPKTGGRVKGGKSLDRGARALVSADLAGSILTTFERLGGVDDMLSWAASNRTVFYTQVLSRLFPAPQRDADDPGVHVNVQTSIGNDFEAARRIAFSLAKAAHEQEQQRLVIEGERVTASRAAPEAVIEPVAQPTPKAPDPVDDMDHDLERARWERELAMSPQERADRELVRDTVECDITN